MQICLYLRITSYTHIQQFKQFHDFSNLVDRNTENAVFTVHMHNLNVIANENIRI